MKTAEELVKEGFKRYPLRSGYMIVEHVGSHTGVDTIYFDHWGWLEAKYSHVVISMMGITQETNTLTLLDGTLMYTIDLDKKHVAAVVERSDVFGSIWRVRL